MADPNVQITTETLTGFDSVPVRITVRVGFARCSLTFLSGLSEGTVIPLDRPVGAPFDLLAGERMLGMVEPVAEGDGVAVKLVGVPEAEDDASR